MASAQYAQAVIFQPWGGLGDNLQYSTLPELFAEQGIATFISTRNVVRNPEIHQLVWGCNPFVQGYSDDEPNAGACQPHGKFPKRLPHLERVELAHGLAPRSTCPKVYYRPSKRTELQNAILTDLGSVSVTHRPSELRNYVSRVVSYNEYDPSCIMRVQFERLIADEYVSHQAGQFPSFVPKNIFDYCDALASCRAFITVHSGAQSLAVALRGQASTPSIHCFCTPRQFNGRDFIFPHVDYHIAERTLTRNKILRSLLKRLPRGVRTYIDSKS